MLQYDRTLGVIQVLLVVRNNFQSCYGIYCFLHIYCHILSLSLSWTVSSLMDSLACIESTTNAYSQ